MLYIWSRFFLAGGTHDKFKLHLLFDGRDQYFQIGHHQQIASTNGLKKAGNIDIKGAFIQMEMMGPPMYICCNMELTWLIVQHLPSLKKYVSPYRLNCHLLKALNGCA